MRVATRGAPRRLAGWLTGRLTGRLTGCLVGCLVAGLLAAAAPGLQAAGQPGADPDSAAGTLFSLANRDRVAQGLQPLRWSPRLAQAAASHDRVMIEQGALEHELPGERGLVERAGEAGVRFRTIAENIAEGGSAAEIEQEWMRSPPHRANLLDPRMNAAAVAVMRGPGGLWAVEDFAEEIPALRPEQIEAEVADLLRQQGIAAASPAPEARAACLLDSGSPPGTTPRFIMRWEAPDASRLPAMLLQRVHSGAYRAAGVGACGADHPGAGFTSYRVAVLLY